MQHELQQMQLPPDAAAPAPVLPLDSWSPPPVYGAPLPPSGARHAQASYYHQLPVPDAQLLGHCASSPWGPQVPWEADAYGFLAEVCGMGTGCGSDAGVGTSRRVAQRLGRQTPDR